jgi:hypothetical protein
MSCREFPIFGRWREKFRRDCSVIHRVTEQELGQAILNSADFEGAVPAPVDNAIMNMVFAVSPCLCGEISL